MCKQHLRNLQGAESIRSRHTAAGMPEWTHEAAVHQYKTHNANSAQASLLSRGHHGAHIQIQHAMAHADTAHPEGHASLTRLGCVTCAYTANMQQPVQTTAPKVRYPARWCNSQAQSTHSRNINALSARPVASYRFVQAQTWHRMPGCHR